MGRSKKKHGKRKQNSQTEELRKQFNKSEDKFHLVVSTYKNLSLIVFKDYSRMF